jgi:plastocyanin
MRESRLYPGLAVSVITSALLAVTCGGGGGGATYNTPTAPAGNTSATLGATIRITANGVVPKDVTITPGKFVRFINDDARPHQIQTNPHLLHTDCPPNNIPILNPGQSADTTAFIESKGCGFHNHLLPDEQTFWGVIRVGTTDEPGPVYSRGW